MMGRGGRRRKQLVNDIKERENIGNLRRNTRAIFVGKLLWKRRRISRKRIFEMNA
jgi:hypothetical protein